MLRKNDTAYHPVYGQVLITEDASSDDQFIGCSFTLNNRHIDFVKLSISSLSYGPKDKPLIWYQHKNLGLLKSSYKNESTDTLTAVTMGGSEIYVPTDSIRQLTLIEWAEILKIDHLIKR